MTSHEKGLPSTFASIRFVAENLLPGSVSSFFKMQPSLAYKKGDVYIVGSRKTEQFRRFGMWLMSTENIVDSNDYNDHLTFIAVNFLTDPASGGVRPGLRALVDNNQYQMTVSLYWFGRSGADQPIIHGNFKNTISECGGLLEQEFDMADNEDEFHAA